MTRLALVTLICAAGLQAAEWGKAVEVRHLDDLCVSYQAKLEDGALIIRADVSEGWHTFTMDNELRATEALAGKMSLGVDMPTQVNPVQGVDIAGPWKQSEPEDFSKPSMRWYSWGYEGEALFSAPAKAAGAGPAVVEIRGQACSDTTCKNIEVMVPVGTAGAGPKTTLAKLIPVRQN